MNPSTCFSDKSPSARGINTKEYIILVIREFVNFTGTVLKCITAAAGIMI